MAFKLGDFFPSKQPNEPGLPLDSPIWKTLEGGYHKSLYDASVALKKLEKAVTIKEVSEIYKELWDELHHQGDVGLASYYAVPHLVRIARETNLKDYHVLGLISLIAIQRYKENQQMPKALIPTFQNAIQDLAELAKVTMTQDWDLNMASSALAAIALANGQIKLANAIMNLDSEDMIDGFLEQ